MSSAIIRVLRELDHIPKPILPNLKQLVWGLHNVDTVFRTHGLHSLFLHPGIETLSLFGLRQDAADAGLDYSFQLVGQDIAHLAPNIRSLSLTLNEIPSQDKMRRLQQQLEAVLPRFEYLSEIYLSPCFLTAAIYRTLGRFTNLKKLSVCNYVDDGSASSTIVPGDVSTAHDLYAIPSDWVFPFQFIDYLSLCVPIHDATAVINDGHFPASRVTRLIVRSTGSRSSTTGAVQPYTTNDGVLEFVTALSTRCSNLKRLGIAIDNPLNPPTETDERISLKSFMPLQQLLELNELGIRHLQLLSDGTDSNLLDLVRPLVNLHTLMIVPTPDWQVLWSPPVPQHTMKTVALLVEALPRLRSLGIYLDLSYHYELPLRYTRRTLTRLCIGTSPVPDEVCLSTLRAHMVTRGYKNIIRGTSIGWARWGFSGGVFTNEGALDEKLVFMWDLVLADRRRMH